MRSVHPKMDGFFPCLTLGSLHPQADGDSVTAGFQTEFKRKSLAVELFEFISDGPVKGRVALTAAITPDTLRLTINGKILTGPATGLLNQQPVGRFTLGSAPADPVGSYASPPPFSGTILAHRVRVPEVGE